MTNYRRWIFLGLAVIGSQLASGCCCQRPVLFPRLGYYGPGVCGPIFPRLAVSYSSPYVSGSPVSAPVYGETSYGGFSYPASGPVYGSPIYGSPGYGAPISSDIPLCTNCGPGNPGLPIAISGPSAPSPGAYSPRPSAGTTVPMMMPTSAAPNGIPFDSAFAPTVKPPTTDRLDSPPQAKKVMLTAGK